MGLKLFFQIEAIVLHHYQLIFNLTQPLAHLLEANNLGRVCDFGDLISKELKSNFRLLSVVFFFLFLRCCCHIILSSSWFSLCCNFWLNSNSFLSQSLHRCLVDLLVALSTDINLRFLISLKWRVIVIFVLWKRLLSLHLVKIYFLGLGLSISWLRLLV